MLGAARAPARWRVWIEPWIRGLVAGCVLLLGSSPGLHAASQQGGAPEPGSPSAASSDELRERLAACASCHGAQGEGASDSEYAPHLAGKPAQYLYEQLRGFRDGGRQHVQMAWLVRHLDDAYLREIGEFYAALPPKTAPAEVLAARIERPGDAVARQLVEQGDAARGLHACGACHGADLVGVEPGVPALVGLPAEYVVAQFGAWRTGVRTAVAPDCMADIANALTPAEIRAVAEWLAVEGHSEPRRPAPAGSLALPVACGSNPVAAPVAVLDAEARP